MKANLNHFRNDLPVRITDPRQEVWNRHTHEGCNQSPRPDMDHPEDIVVIRSSGFEGYV
jgi:hypothetical protein